MTKEQAWCVALWVMTTHAFAAAVIAAKLWITSAVLRSGKTRLMRVLKHLVARPETAEYITPSAIFRLIDRDRPTLLLDEVDTFIADSEDLRGLSTADSSATARS
jgi:putative DNA primase/helicase